MGDTAAADADWAQARELTARDAVVDRRYAKFLLGTGRARDAERELRAVLSLEPDWVDARYELALALAAPGDATREVAAAALEDFLARALASASAARRDASERLGALRSH